MKKIVILGSTGSIGSQALQIIKNNQENFDLLAITCNKNITKFINQITEFKPKFAFIEDKYLASAIKTKVSHINTIIISENIDNLISKIGHFDVLLSAISTISGMMPTVKLLPYTKILAIANKESIVCGGKIFMDLVKSYGIKIIPVDSEHNSIYRLMKGTNHQDINSITLTASGGPFFGKKFNEIQGVNIKDALKHPNWSMGVKNTIDSATMANKALEIIEAAILFDLKYDKINAIIERNSIIHGFLEFKDMSQTAFFSKPDMKIHIAHAISDEKIIFHGEKIDLLKTKLEFFEIDRELFKAFYLGKYALKNGHISQIIFNSANEIAVEKLINGEIKFLEIPNIIDKALSHDFNIEINNVDDIIHLDTLVKKFIQ